MICQRDDPATGGAARVAVELVGRLAMSPDIEVVCLFAYGGPGALSTDVRAHARWLNIGSNRHALLGMFRLRREIRRFDPDVIYHHDGLTWTHIVSWTFPRTLVIGHAHLDGPQPGASLRRRLAHWVHAKTYRRLVAVSDFTRARWQELGFPAENAVVLRNGVDGASFRPPSPAERATARSGLGLPADAKVVTSVGRLHCGMKGTDDFLRVFAKLGPHWNGLVAGTGPDRDRLERLAFDLGIRDRVYFAGLVDPVLSAYHAADVLAITSHYEPFGLIAVEALASGVPVVGLECQGGVVEILKDTEQMMVAGRDLDAMAQAIEAAEGNRPAGRDALLAKFDWQSAADRLEAWLHDWTEARGEKS
ncbi:hypothetical protein TP2_17360 [Thioclava pacifica DSM 10166]|uniref:Glycosyltransferase subfamily 4-like N-terminal domain-containing protein n=2 Tax=Thioclava pacifica TaxID=285109 RepID=A0A074JGK8_9RHOB|nr:hypothetical protein TP2_17360 [Thioclava pacifica DSM 10166]